jgi:hypothetical protein
LRVGETIRAEGCSWIVTEVVRADRFGTVYAVRDLEGAPYYLKVLRFAGSARRSPRWRPLFAIFAGAAFVAMGVSIGLFAVSCYRMIQ